jgi:hypothetical protein
MLCILNALQKFGFKVEYYSQIDDSPHYYEKQALNKAIKKSASLNSSITVNSMLKKISSNKIALVIYELPGEEPHISPLIGCENSSLKVPLGIYSKTLPKAVFTKAWSVEGICRQVITVEAS